jgi:hypothetical protein
MSERLPAHVEAAALIRQAEAEGGFATILKKGDADRGALILMIARRGVHHGCLERTLSPDSVYRWQTVGPPAGSSSESLAEWSQKRVRFDEDLWLIELDIAEPERFIAETTAEG